MTQSTNERLSTVEADIRNESLRQTRHEDTCTKRYEALDDNMVRVHSRIDKVFNIGLALTCTTILTLVTALIGLLSAHPH